MPRPTQDELENELRATMASGLGGLFEDGDAVAIRTHSGELFNGTVEDSNLAGVLVRVEQADPAQRSRLFFVSFAGIESAEIFEAEETDDEPEDKRADEPEPAEPGNDVTPISTARAS